MTATKCGTVDLQGVARAAAYVVTCSDLVLLDEWSQSGGAAATRRMFSLLRSCRGTEHVEEGEPEKGVPARVLAHRLSSEGGLSSASSEVCHLTCHHMGGRRVMWIWTRHPNLLALAGHSRDLLCFCSFEGLGPLFHIALGSPTFLVGAQPGSSVASITCAEVGLRLCLLSVSNCS